MARLAATGGTRPEAHPTWRGGSRAASSRTISSSDAAAPSAAWPLPLLPPPPPPWAVAAAGGPSPPGAAAAALPPPLSPSSLAPACDSSASSSLSPKSHVSAAMRDARLVVVATCGAGERHSRAAQRWRGDPLRTRAACDAAAARRMACMQGSATAARPRRVRANADRSRGAHGAARCCRPRGTRELLSPWRLSAGCDGRPGPRTAHPGSQPWLLKCAQVEERARACSRVLGRVRPPPAVWARPAALLLAALATLAGVPLLAVCGPSAVPRLRAEGATCSPAAIGEARRAPPLQGECWPARVSP
jgi:hypothetical protein